MPVHAMAVLLESADTPKSAVARKLCMRVVFMLVIRLSFLVSSDALAYSCRCPDSPNRSQFLDKLISEPLRHLFYRVATPEAPLNTWACSTRVVRSEVSQGATPLDASPQYLAISLRC